MVRRKVSEPTLTVPLLKLGSSFPSNPILLSTTNVDQSRGLDVSSRDECSDVFFEVSRSDLFTSPCSKICHHLIYKLLIIKCQILHSIDIGIHLLRPLCLDGGLSPRMTVKSSALSEILDAVLKAYRDARMIRTALKDVQTTLKTDTEHCLLTKCVVVV